MAHLCRSWTLSSFVCPGWSGTACTMCCRACCRGWRTCWPGSLRIMQATGPGQKCKLHAARPREMGRRRCTLARIAKAGAKGASRARWMCSHTRVNHSSGKASVFGMARAACVAVVRTGARGDGCAAGRVDVVASGAVGAGRLADARVERVVGARYVWNARDGATVQVSTCLAAMYSGAAHALTGAVVASARAVGALGARYRRRPCMHAHRIVRSRSRGFRVPRPRTYRCRPTLMSAQCSRSRSRRCTGCRRCCPSWMCTS